MENIDERLGNFHKTLDNWISEHKIDYGANLEDERFKEICRIMRFTEQDLKSLSAIDIQTAIYNLNYYMHYIHVITDREKAVKAWVEQTIGYIISGLQFDKFLKWEEKYNLAIRSHKSGVRLQMLKTTADYRILSGNNSISTIQNAIKVLENIGRNRGYDRS